MCKILNVSRSGYYAWKNKLPSKRLLANEILLKQIIAIYEKNRKVYGSPRIHATLQIEGFKCGVNRVAKLMKCHKIQAQQYKRMKQKVK